MSATVIPRKVARARPAGELLARRPEATAAALITLAWAVLVPLTMPSAGDMDAAHSASGGMGMFDGSAAVVPVYRQVINGLPLWVLMTVAMMGPATLGAVRHTGINSLRWRRQRAVAEFAAGYLLVWTVAGVGILSLLDVAPVLATPLGFAVVLTVTAGWELTSPKRRILQRCHRSTPLPITGLAAELGALRFGAYNGSACVASCSSLMLGTMLAPGPQAVAVMAGSIAITCERCCKRPRHATHIIAATLASLAIVTAAIAL